MQNQGTHDRELQKLQDALLHRIINSKIPEEREQLLNLHRRLLRQRRVKQVAVAEEYSQQKELV